MEKILSSVYRLLVTIVTLTAASTLYAQEYESVGTSCFGLTVVTPSTYVSGSGAPAARSCLEFNGSIIEQPRKTCITSSDAAFEVSLGSYTAGDYYFLWPSLRTRNGLDNNINKWYKATVLGTDPATVTVPSTADDAWANGGFGTADKNGYLLIYSETHKTLDSVLISNVELFEPFTPGTIKTSSKTVCQDGAADNITEATAPLGGSGTYTYQWYKNNKLIDDATNSTYTPAAETATGVYEYTRKVSVTGCSATAAFSTGTYTLTVVADPTVTIEKTGPGSATICYNTDAGTLTANLSSDAVGGPYTYIWQSKAGTDSWSILNGITAGTYAPGNLAKTTAFKVSATGSGSSGCAAPESDPSTTITVYPVFSAGAFKTDAGGTVCVNGQPAEIPSDVIDTAPWGGSDSYSYKWYRNNVPIDPMVTAEYFTPSSETVTGAVTYTRQVKDEVCGNEVMTAGSYILQVQDKPTVGLTAASDTICYDTRATVFTATPIPGATYTWYSRTNGIDWDIAEGGKTANSFTTGGNLKTNTFYSVTVAVSDVDCPEWVSAAPATITVRDPFSAGTIPSETDTICAGGTPKQITGGTNASGGDVAATTYTWKYRYNGGGEQTIASSDTAAYTPQQTEAGTYHYYRYAGDGKCQPADLAATGSYTLVIVDDPTITGITATGPGSATICYSTDAGTLTAALSSDAVGGPYTYTWQKNEAGAGWAPVDGSNTASTYAPGALTVTTSYHVKADGLLGCAADFIATPSTITVYPVFSAGSFADNAGGEVCINGTPAAIGATAFGTERGGGSGNYSYEWYRNGELVSSSDVEYLSTLSSETVTGAVTYTRMVSDDASCGSGMTAGSYILTVTPTPKVHLTAASTTICHDTPATVFTETPVTGATAYAWYSSTDGITWDEASGDKDANSFTTVNLTTGARYRVDVTVDNTLCPLTLSDTIAIDVYDEFNAGSITSATYTICVGGSPVEINGTTAPASGASGGDGSMTYQWKYSSNGGTTWNDIPSNNDKDYIPSTEAETAGTYHYQRWAKDGTCQSDSTVATGTYTLVVLPVPSVNITPETQVVCHGAAATFTVGVTDNTGGATTYTWEQQKESDTDWSEVGASYTAAFTSGTISEETAFRVTLTQPGSGCTSTVSTATVTLNAALPEYKAPGNVTTVTKSDGCSATLTHNGSTVILQGTYTDNAACPDSLYYTISGATTFTGPKTAKQNPLTSLAFNKGVSVVTYTAKNALGGSASSTFSVTVNDEEPPVIACKAGSVYLDATGNAVLDVSTLISASSDNCGTTGLVYETNPPSASSFTCENLGDNQVWVHAIDASGNYSSQCAATVTVVNDQPPVAVCKAKDTLYLNSGKLTAERLAAASSTSNCKQQPLTYYILKDDTDDNSTKTDTTFACTAGGATHTIYVGVKNMVNGEMKVCSTEVLVTDTVLQCTPKAIDTLYINSGCSYTLIPEKDGDLIPMSIATPYRGCADELTPVPGMRLVNDKGFDIYASPFVSPEFAAGSTYEITWTLKDNFDNAWNHCKDTFAVVDTIRPVFTSSTVSQLSRTIVPGSCTISVTLPAEPGFEDNCTGATLLRTDTLGASPLNLTRGTYTVKYVAKDVWGNVSKDTSKIVITVLDESIPAIDVISDTTMQVGNNDPIACFAAVPVGGLRPVVSNACLTGSTITYTAKHESGEPSSATTTVEAGFGGATFTVGATAVTYTVTAANGNTANRTFTVTVQDTVKPKITCPGDVVRKYDESGSYTVATAEKNSFDVAVENKCVGEPAKYATIDGGATQYSTLENHVFSGALSFTVQWTVTDAVTPSNTSTCSYTVTMRDTIPPVFESFPNDTIRVNTNTDDCFATVPAASFTATYTDAATPASVTITHTKTYKDTTTLPIATLLPETIFEKDTTVVTYTITDKAGNSRDSSFLVIVTDNVPPVFQTCPDNITGLKIAASPTADCKISSAQTLTAPTYDDNCGAVKTLAWSITNSRVTKDTSSLHGADAINKLPSYQFAAGTNTVRYTATDSSGNTAVCSFTVEVADKVIPECRSLPSYTLQLQSTGTATLDPLWIDNGSTDNCDSLIYTLSTDSQKKTFDCSDIGTTYNVYLVVTDEFGNFNKCSPTAISVEDAIAPVVSCTSVSVYLDAQASASLTAIDLEKSASDECTTLDDLERAIFRADGVSVTNDTTFNCAAVGQTYTLTLRVRDESDNAGTCTSTVTVRDTLLNRGAKRDTVEADEGACIATLTAGLDPAKLLDCSAATLTAGFFGTSVNTYAGSTLSVGTHTITWTLDDGQGVKTITDTIVVKDTQKPVLTRTQLMEDITPTVESGCTVTAVTWYEPEIFINMTVPDTLAKDNCTDASALTWRRVDADTTLVKNGVGTVPVGRWKIQYVAKDEAGNESDTLSFFVWVQDNTVPVFTCPGVGGKDTVFVDPAIDPTACEVTITDPRFTPVITGLCAGDSLSYAYTFNGGSAVTEGAGSLEGLTLPVGLYSVTYTATNKFAASPTFATCNFTLAVRDTIKPTFIRPTNGTRGTGLSSDTYQVQGGEFDVKNEDDNCRIDTVFHNYHGGGTTLADTLLPAGTHTIKWTVRDIHGNEDTCKVKVTVNDEMPPVFDLDTTHVVDLDENGAGALTLAEVIIHLSDNVTDSSAIITTLTPSAFTCADIGKQSATFTATDLADNAATATIEVTVRDVSPATFTLRNPTVYLNAAGAGTLTLDSVIVTLGDNCTDLVDIQTSLSDSTFTCADIALLPHTVTFTATDGHDNVSSGTVAVTVTDTIKPKITCVTTGLEQQTRATDCYYPVNGEEFDPTVAHGCSYTLSHNYNGGGNTLADTLLPAGTHTITWTATNLSGYAATCDVTVKVKDITPPIITCPPSVAEIKLPSGCTTTAVITNPNPVRSDNCGIDSLKWTISRGGIVRDSSDNYGSGKTRTIPADYEFSAGTNVITYTVTDASGNSSMCSFTVPVKENEIPTCLSVNTYTLKLQGPGITPLDPKKIDSVSFDNCTAASDLSFDFFVKDGVGDPNFTCADIGKSRPVRLRVKDISGNPNTCLETFITVKDTIAPEAICVQDTTLYLKSDGTVRLFAAALDSASTDNCADPVHRPIQPLSIARYSAYVLPDTASVYDTLLTCTHVTESPLTMTVVVKDYDGNVGTCTVQVTVKDTLKPVITFNRGNNITVPTSGPTGCVAKLDATFNPEITKGNKCQTLISKKNSVNDLDTYAGMSLSLGSHTITWTAVSEAGTTTAIDTITVIDALAPTLKLPMANQRFQSVEGCLSENPVFWTEPGPANAEDNCTSALTWTYDAPAGVVRGEPVPVGVWEIKYVAKDSSGNVSDTVRFELVIFDSSNPRFSACPSDTVKLDIDAAHVCVATVPYTDELAPTISDLCPNIDSLAYKITSGSFTEEGAGSLAGRTLSAGSYSATYTAYNRTYLTKTATCSFDVVVRDTAAPVVAVHPKVDVYLGTSGSYTLPMDSVILSLSDKCTDSLTIITTLSTLTPNTFTCANIGEQSATFTAKDEHGNESSRTFTVNVIDMIKPVVTVRPEVTVYLEASGSYTLPMDSVIVSLRDNCTDSLGIIARSTLTPNTFTCADIGKQSATFTAKDERENVSSKTFTVHVRDMIKPVVTCKATDTLMAINAAGDPVTFTAQSLVTAEARGCAAASALTYSFSNSAYKPDTTYTCAKLVTEELTVYVTDVNSNEASCTITVTVRDTLPPVITKKDQIVETSSPVDLTESDVLYSLTDNCTDSSSVVVTIKNTTLGSTTFTCENNIGWIYAQDANGKKDSVVFSVIFDSSTPATVTAHDTTLYLDAAGKAVLSAYEVVEDVTDNCVAETVFKDPAKGLLTLDRTEFDCRDVGAVGGVTVTIFAQGSALNPGTATFTVTVLDTIKPTITCATNADVSVDDATCKYRIVGTEFNPLDTADNCGIRSVLHNYNGGGTTLADTLLPVGTHTITWTVTDVSDSTATCPVVITVKDHEKPVITCKDDYIAYLDANGKAEVNAKDLVTVTKECAPLADLAYIFVGNGTSTTHTSCSHMANTQYADIRVTDLSGNSSTCTAQFTVRDALPPVIVLKDPIRLPIISGTGVTQPAIKDSILNLTETKDNCTAVDDLVVVIEPLVYSCKVSTGTVTVTDKQNKSSSATFSVTFTDIPPMDVTVLDKTLTLNASGSATLSAYDVVTNVTDFCVDGSVIMNPANDLITFRQSLRQSTFTCADVGGAKKDTVFVRRSASAAPETFTFKVTVEKNPPTITCKPEFVPAFDIGAAQCDITIQDGALDNNIIVLNSQCSYTLKNDYNNSNTLVGATFEIGTHTVTWTVTDGDGRSAQCTYTVKVSDKHKPDIVCEQNVPLALGSAGTVSVRAEDLLESATDCSTPLTYAFSTGESEIPYACADMGVVRTLTVKVTDAAGNYNTCEATVEVHDNLPPQFTVNGNGTVTVRAKETLTPAQVITNLSDNCTSNDDILDPANNLVRFEPKTVFDCEDGNAVPATITVSDEAGNEASVSFTVQVDVMKPAYDPLIVKDTTLNLCSPSDTLPENIGVILPANVDVCGAPATVTYTDVSYQGTDKTRRDYYNYIIERTWTASAGGGNDSVVVQTITVEDTLKPVIVTADTLAVYLGQDGKGTPDVYNALISVTDCATDSADVIIHYYGDPREFDCSHIGASYTITVTGTDPSGKVSEPDTVTVTVQDTLPPVITPRGSGAVTLSLEADGTATLIPRDVIEKVEDNCTAIDTFLSRTAFNVNDMKADVPVWVYATDQYGNKDSVQVWITVIDDVQRNTSIEKDIRGRDVANEGEIVTFVIRVTNTFGGDRDLIIVDSLPEGLIAVDIPLNSSADLARRVVTIHHTHLDPEKSVEYVITARVEKMGDLVNHAYLYRRSIDDKGYVDNAYKTLHATQPELVLTAKIREGDYTNVEASPSIYNVPGDYRLVVNLENKGGATADRPVNVRINYNPDVHRFAGSSRGGDVKAGDTVLVWTLPSLNGYYREEMELSFVPRRAATYTFKGAASTLTGEEPSDNVTSVKVNQSIINVPNVVTAENPNLYIKDMDNEAITEASIRVINTWGNQVYYVRHRKEEINGASWFNSANLARGTYWYELVVYYENGMSYVIKDYVEVLK